MIRHEESIPAQSHGVVVVGTGLAGLAAALTAKERGAHVLVIDKAPESARGGNTRFSGGGLRCPTPEHPEAALVEELMRVTGGRAHPRLARVLYREANGGVQWLRELGVPMASPSVERPDMRGHIPWHVQGNGYGLVEALFPRLAERGIPVRFETKATDLLTDRSGRVTGVRAKGREGFVDLLAGAVVLASGGFQANTEMRARYLGRDADGLVVRGSRYNTGDGLLMALAIGAQPFGQWGDFHSAVIDARSSPVEAGETNINSYPYTIMVNRRGERFVDEGADWFDVTYVRYGKAILEQPGQVAFCLFDAKLAEQGLVYGLREDLRPVEAGSLERLAEQLGIPADRLAATVEAFNRAVLPGPFDPERLDGKGTRGLTPPKSNWAVPLDTPPFFAIPVTGGITFTFGGLRVDERARVVDTEDRAIPGLYAAGEILGGFFFTNYPGGASLVRSLVFGRLAGAGAAETAAARGAAAG